MSGESTSQDSAIWFFTGGPLSPQPQKAKGYWSDVKNRQAFFKDLFSELGLDIMQPDSIKQLRATQVLGKKVKSPLPLCSFCVWTPPEMTNPLYLFIYYRAGRPCWDITTTAYAKHFVKLFLKLLCHLLLLQSPNEQQEYLFVTFLNKNRKNTSSP